jgi:hypothetical protein
LPEATAAGSRTILHSSDRLRIASPNGHIERE